jgi:transcriptional regulator with XRE-family HTH domain
VPVISCKFADELAEKDMRDAYVEAQTRVKIAHQIRSLRTQRNWSQGDLGKRLGKPQSNVSRLEDVEVGKYTLSSLFELAAVFDVALIVDFASYPDFLRSTGDLSPRNLQRPIFDRQSLQELCEDSHVAAQSQHPFTWPESFVGQHNVIVKPTIHSLGVASPISLNQQSYSGSFISGAEDSNKGQPRNITNMQDRYMWNVCPSGNQVRADAP